MTVWSKFRAPSPGGRRLKLLVLSFFPAFDPPRSGGELRLLHLYRALARHCDVTLLSSTDFGARREVVQHQHGLREIRFPKDHHWRTAYATLERAGLAGELSGLAFALAVGEPDCALRLEAERLAGEADIVVHEFPYSAPIFADAPPRPEVYNAHNFELALLPSIVTGPGLARAFERVRLLEGALARRCRLVLAPSDRDAEALRLMYGVRGSRIAVCPNGFDAEEFAPVLAERRHRRRAGGGAGTDGRPRLLFTGSGHRPNVEAARFLLRKAAPALPEVDIVVAGSVCDALNDGAPVPPNVVLAGPFDEREKHALFVAADAYVNPVVEGSGTNLKTVEALAAGLPLISTPEGVRGIPVRPEHEAVVAERGGFVEAVRAAMAAPEALARYAEAGEALARRTLTWTGIADALAARLSALAAGDEAPAGERRPERPLILAFNDYAVAAAPFGGARRIREVLGSLAREIGGDVALVCFGDRPDARLVEPGFLQVTIAPEERHREVQRTVNALAPVSANDVIAGLFCAANRSLVAAAAELARRCSAVVFEHCYMAPLLDAIFPDGCSVPVVYSAHNVEATLKPQLLERHPLRAELVDFAARVEAELARRADLVVACSADDAGHFAAAGARTVLVPNGCSSPDDTRAAKPGAPAVAAEGAALRVGFMGSSHPPNVEAAKFILEELAPALPEVRFEFLGEVCNAVGRPRAPNVLMHGVLDEATKSSVLRSWDAALNPLASGGGSSLKVPEYLVHGLATLSTPEGVRGFAVAQAGAGVVVPRDRFAEALAELLADAPGRRALGERAARYARENLTWSAACLPYAKALRDLIQRTAPRRRQPERKLLIVTYRYTEPALGGAEEYLIQVASRLRPHFARIDLAAVGVGELTNQMHFGCRLAAAEGGSSGILGELFDRTTFFAPDEVPAAEMEERCRRLEQAWLRDGAALVQSLLDRLAPDGRPMLLGGFNGPEFGQDGIARRWTSGKFEALLPPGSQIVELAGWSPYPKTVRLRVAPAAGGPMAASPAPPDSIRPTVEQHFVLRFTLPPADAQAPLLLTGEVEPHSHQGDPRPLGLVLERLSVLRADPLSDAGGGLRPVVEAQADFAEEAEAVLRSRHLDAWMAAVLGLTRTRGAEEEADFAAVRGPHSAAMQDWLRRHAAGYDTVLVQGIPFDVIPRTVETLSALDRPRPHLVLLPHFHGDDRFYYWRRYLDAFARADRTLLFSRTVADLLGGGERLTVVPGGGVDATEFALPDSVARFREVLDIREPFFLVLGRKTGSKGYQRAVQAVRSLRDAGREVALVLIGPDEDGVAVGGQGVHVLGQQPREVVLGALAQCLGLVSMSVSESFGIVLCEAWKFRKPVVANRACYSFRELVEDGTTGLLVETDAELAAALDRLLGDAPLRDRLGAAGFAAVTQRYSWEMTARAVARELAGGARTAA